MEDLIKKNLLKNKPDSLDNMELSIIKDSTILEESELTPLVKLKDELEKTFNTVQMFRTRTEMEISVLDRLKHPTPDSRFWQSQREQNVMFQELVMLSFEYQKNLKEIELLVIEAEKNVKNMSLINFAGSEQKIKKMKTEQDLIFIEIHKKEFISINQKRTAKSRLEEIINWHEIKENLEKEMRFGTDDPDDHQLASYTMRFMNQYLNLVKYKPQNVGIAEINNLMGQLRTAVLACDNKGILNDILSQYSVEDARKIMSGKLPKNTGK